MLPFLALALLDNAIDGFETPAQLFAAKQMSTNRRQILFKASALGTPVFRQSIDYKVGEIDPSRGLAYDTIRNIVDAVSKVAGYRKSLNFYGFRRHMANALEIASINPDLRNVVLSHTSNVYRRYYADATLSVDAQAIARREQQRPDLLEELRKAFVHRDERAPLKLPPKELDEIFSVDEELIALQQRWNLTAKHCSEERAEIRKQLKNRKVVLKNREVKRIRDQWFTEVCRSTEGTQREKGALSFSRSLEGYMDGDTENPCYAIRKSIAAKFFNFCEDDSSKVGYGFDKSDGARLSVLQRMMELCITTPQGKGSLKRRRQEVDDVAEEQKSETPRPKRKKLSDTSTTHGGTFNSSLLQCRWHSLHPINLRPIGLFQPLQTSPADACLQSFEGLSQKEIVQHLAKHVSSARYLKDSQRFHCMWNGCCCGCETRDDLRAHLFHAHQVTTKIFPITTCPLCDENFGDEFSWRSHCKTHFLNDGLQACPLGCCSVCFNNADLPAEQRLRGFYSGLKSHVIKKHGKKAVGTGISLETRV